MAVAPLLVSPLATESARFPWPSNPSLRSVTTILQPSPSASFLRRIGSSSTWREGLRRNVRTTPAAVMFRESPVVSDVVASSLSGGIALSFLRLFEESSSRKLVRISIGSVFMLCWPMFSSGHRGAILATLVPGINIVQVLLVGSGIWKDKAIVKSMSRFGDRRKLLKGPPYHATTITLASAYCWRTSRVAIIAICNICAGDGLADIVGRRFGHHKIPYNSNKSWAGSIAMAIAGFLASLGYMFNFSSFGFVQETWEMAFGFCDFPRGCLGGITAYQLRARR